MTTSECLITAILPDDVDTVALAAEARDRFGVEASFRHNARGVGTTTRRQGPARLMAARRTLFWLLIDRARSDAVFDWLAKAAHINRPGGGIVFVQALPRTMTTPLPDLPAEQPHRRA